MAHSTGQIINNRYRIVSLIAQGGFGALYRAWDMNLNTAVALKENLSASSASLHQFTFEAQLLAKLRHENLPYVIDHFTIPEQGQYLVMEYIDGKDLQTILDERSRPFSEREAREWLSRVSSAVAYLHSQSPPIIHRDIKPANIKITASGRVLLVDFGIAKAYKPTQHTTAGAKAITQGFSPPEQYGGGITDARSDIYSLGATLYTLLTGRVPVESVQRHTGAVFLSPREIEHDISPEIEKIILKAMELNPTERFQTAEQLYTALNEPVSLSQVDQVKRKSPPTFPTTLTPSVESVSYKLPNQERPPSGFPGQVIRFPLPRRRKKKLALSSIAIITILCFVAGVGISLGLYSLVYIPGLDTTSKTDVLASTLTELVWSARFTLTAESYHPSATDPNGLTQSESPTSLLVPSDTPVPMQALTISPDPTVTPVPKPTWFPCSGTYPSRLYVSDRAFVSSDPPIPNRVRTQPDSNSEILGYLDVLEKMEIIEGPICSSTWIWWRIRSLDKNLTGWTAEGEAENYWLVPLR